jgi:hypothetical protein
MSVVPATYDLRIPQRATFEQEFTLPFDCNGKTVLAQVWSARRAQMLLEFETVWLNRAEPVVPTGFKGRFRLRADWQQTALVTKDGVWDLLVINDATGDRDYYLEGKAVLDPGQTEAVTP